MYTSLEFELSFSQDLTFNKCNSLPGANPENLEGRLPGKFFMIYHINRSILCLFGRNPPLITIYMHILKSPLSAKIFQKSGKVCGGP